jgi:hypothetical protein
VALFFDAAYAAVIFLALALVGVLPGWTLGLVVPREDRRLLVPAVALAVAGWIWAGWLGGRYGISRPGLIFFTAIGASGFVYGWSTGLRAGRQARGPRRRTRTTPSGRGRPDTRR